MLKVGPNTHVVIKYTVRFEENAVPEEKLNVYRANLLIGYDRIIPAIEEKLLGTKEGDIFEIVIPKGQYLGANHPIYARISVEEVRPATPEDIAVRTAKSCSGG
jgi:FKBP-type peptidyl-prolyl cis-trans isomerase 2